jgi:hypothetical protein
VTRLDCFQVSITLAVGGQSVASETGSVGVLTSGDAHLVAASVPPVTVSSQPGTPVPQTKPGDVFLLNPTSPRLGFAGLGFIRLGFDRAPLGSRVFFGGLFFGYVLALRIFI